MTKKFIVTYNINIDEVIRDKVVDYMEDVKKRLLSKDTVSMKEFLGEENVIEFFIPVKGIPTEIKVTTVEVEGV